MPIRKAIIRRIKPTQQRKQLAASDVQRLWFTRNMERRIIRIGGGDNGDVYIGRLKFKNGKTHRVAIKVFKGIETKFHPNFGVVYTTVIQNLLRAGVPLPKMGVVQIETPWSRKKEWVLVSELFGSSKRGSKLTPIEKWSDFSLDAKIKITRTLTRIINAGYNVHQDVLQKLSLEKPGVPIDIDYFFFQQFDPNFIPHNSISKRVRDLQLLITKMTGRNKEDYNRLMAVAINEANPAEKKALQS